MWCVQTLNDKGASDVGCVAMDIRTNNISPPITDVSIIAHKYPWPILSTKNIPHKPKQTQRMPANRNCFHEPARMLNLDNLQ